MRTGSIVRPPRRRARRYPRALEFLPHFRMPVRADSPYGMAPKDLAFAASVLTRHPVTAARKAPRLCPGHRLSNGWRCRPDTFSEPYRSFETNRVFPNRIRGVNRLTAAIATTCAGSQRLPVFTFGTNDGAPLQNSKTLAWPGAIRYRSDVAAASRSFSRPHRVFKPQLHAHSCLVALGLPPIRPGNRRFLWGATFGRSTGATSLTLRYGTHGTLGR